MRQPLMPNFMRIAPVENVEQTLGFAEK